MKILLVLFSLSIPFINSSCTVIGLYTGVKSDMNSYSDVSVDFDSLTNLENGDYIRIILKSHTMYEGTFLSIIDYNSENPAGIRDSILSNSKSGKKFRCLLLQIDNSDKMRCYAENKILKIEKYKRSYKPIIGTLIGFGFDFFIFTQIKKNFKLGSLSG